MHQNQSQSLQEKIPQTNQILEYSFKADDSTLSNISDKFTLDEQRLLSDSSCFLVKYILTGQSGISYDSKQEQSLINYRKGSCQNNGNNSDMSKQIEIQKESSRQFQNKQEITKNEKSKQISSKTQGKLTQNQNKDDQGNNLKLFNQKISQDVSMKINRDKLTLDSQSIQMSNINKIVIKKSRKPNQKYLQIHFKQKDKKKQFILLAIPPTSTPSRKFTLDYYTFSKIIQSKCKFQNKYHEVAWQKTDHVQQKVMHNSYIYGKIYKKAQYTGSWQSRYIVINQTGLFSYRDQKKLENSSFTIEKTSIKYIWSQFNLYEKLLIVGLKHGSFIPQDTCFGIPINQIMLRNGKNWLFQFYRMIS